MTSQGHNTTDLCTAQAIRAWTRRHSGAWTEGDETQLQQWLAAAPENRTAYDKIGRVWSSLGQLQGRVQWTQPQPRPNLRRLSLAAAILVAVLCIPTGFVAYYWWNGTATTWNAPRGATRSLSLADGTQIVLDAGSQIESRIGARARHVKLLRGEALLHVIHDARRPFEVTVGAGRIVDLGTRFDVENLGGRARVTVLEGRVDLETAGGKVVLEAGNAGGFDLQGNLLPVRQINTSTVLWTNGQRHFDADRLSDVLARLERYHAVTFRLTTPQLEELRLSGTFRTNDLPLFLRTLQAALPIESRWTDSQHVEISPRAPR